VERADDAQPVLTVMGVVCEPPAAEDRCADYHLTLTPSLHWPSSDAGYRSPVGAP
jgi:hypothetical protein